jgi:glycosyltransferase involved in cell wall biosynthesis
MKRLSIIVPIYNVELYVERCLRSLENQDILKDDYEIICINDGSSDASRSVVIRLQKEFSNISLLDQENYGVSIARNNGINRAQGNYIMMVDADDYLEPNVLNNKLGIMDKFDLDIGFCGYTILNDALNVEYCYDPLFNAINVLSGIEYEYAYERSQSEIREPHRSWAIFLKSRFLNLNNLRYLVGVPYLEDGEFMARVTCLAKRARFINGLFYLKTTRSGSATISTLFHSEKARNGFLKAANHLLQFKNKSSLNVEQKVFMNLPIIHFTVMYLISYEKVDYLKHYTELYNSLKKGPLNKLDTEGCTNFYRKLGSYYNFSILGFYLYWMFHRLSKSLKIRYKKIWTV